MTGNYSLKFELFIVQTYFPLIAHLEESQEIVKKVGEMIAPLRTNMKRDGTAFHTIESVEETMNNADKDDSIFTPADPDAEYTITYSFLINTIIFKMYAISTKLEIAALKDEGETTVSLTDTLLSYLYNSPSHLPMLTKPKEYNFGEQGIQIGEEGFSSRVEGDTANTQPYLRQSTSPVHASFSRIKAVLDPMLAISLNHAQSVAFQVKPSDLLTHNYFDLANMEIENMGYKRLEITRQSTHLLDAFSRPNTQVDDLPQLPFYCPTFVDYRGRMYYYGGALNPQTINFVRAHIQLHEGSPFDRESLPLYLCFLANEAGIKGSFLQKV